jgi:hypothetical protein
VSERRKNWQGLARLAQTTAAAANQGRAIGLPRVLTAWGYCETAVMCPIVKPTRSPPGAQRPQPCCFWQKGATSPASTCISAVNSLVTALTGWKRPVGAQNCALKALEDLANHCSCPLNSPAQARPPPLSSTRATWRRGGHPPLSAPVTLARETTVIAQRGSVAISLEATFPTCQTLTSSSGGVEVFT